jgi:hypothetical protein
MTRRAPAAASCAASAAAPPAAMTLLGWWNVCEHAGRWLGAAQRRLRRRGCPERRVRRLAPALFWAGLFAPSHAVLWRCVLPHVGAPALRTAFAAADLLHVALFVATARADPGVLRIGPQESEELVAAGERARLCPHTGVALVCRAQCVARCARPPRTPHAAPARLALPPPGGCECQLGGGGARYVPFIEEVVGRFDHYCDWLHNAIGARNHLHFLALMAAQTVALWLGAALAVLRMVQLRDGGAGGGAAAQPSALPVAALLLFCVAVGLANLDILVLQLRQISANITSHEVHARRRLTYLWGDVRG